MREAIATGRNVDVAIEAACEQIGLPREEVEIEILDLPRKGFLGLTHTPAKVRVYVLDSEEPVAPVAPAAPVARPAAPPPQREQPRREERAAPRDEALEALEALVTPPFIPTVRGPAIASTPKGEAAAAYLREVLGAMGLDEATVSLRQEEQSIQLGIEGDATGVAIGRRGETLDALQYLVGLAANRVEGEYSRIVLDSGNYRDKRRYALEQLARKLASSSMKTGRSTTLEPMNPYERRIIHSTVSEIEGVTSTSVGEEPNRCVVISSTSPRTERPQGERVERPIGPSNDRPPRRDDRRDGRGPRPGGRDGRGPRFEKPAPYQESSRREVAPAEAVDKPLYGKIEL